MQVESFLETSAAARPDKVALICGGQRMTYGELDRLANRLAHSLAAGGVARGDRVVLQLENSVEAVVGIFAALKAGGVFVVINPSVKAGKLAYILRNCRAKAFVTDAVRLREVGSAEEDLPYLRGIWAQGEVSAYFRSIPVHRLQEALASGADGREGLPRGIDMDLAALIYTSGSTGRPKGVMLTHLNIVSAATSITTYLENTPDDVILNVLPLSFDYGLYQILMGFKIGGTVVLEKSFTYPRLVLDLLSRENVTGFPIVPTISAVLLQMDLKKYRFPALRYITNTGAALPMEHVRQLRESLPGVKIYLMYGLTECKRVSYLPPDQIDLRPGSIGRGMPNEEVFLVDEQGRRLPHGSIGELVVRGSNVMKGYWELPEETAKVLRPGLYPWEQVLYTGDIFRSDEDGYLYFLGRKDDIIKTRGEKVSPREVEEVLYRLPEVAEAAVIGVADAVLGQAVKAVVAPRPGCTLTEQQVRLHCARHLEDYMVPKQIEIRDALPKTPSGKIAKRELAPAQEVAR